MPKNFGKNLAKSFKYGVVDTFLKNTAPDIAETLESNKEDMKTLLDSNAVKGLTKSDVKGMLKKQSTEIKKGFNDVRKNLLDDIKSGKWFGNQERSSKSMQDAMFGDMGDLFGDDDFMDSLDFEEGEFTTEKNSTSGDLDFNFETNNETNVTDNRTSVNNITQIQNKVDGKLLASVTGQMVNSMATISTQIKQISQFHLDETRRYYNDNLSLLTEISSTLKNTYILQTPTAKKSVLDDIFIGNTINLKAYGKALSGSMLGGMIDRDNLDMLKMMGKTMLADPIKTVLDFTLENMIPKTVKKSMKELNDTFVNTTKALVLQLAEGKQGKGSPLQRVLGNILGLDITEGAIAKVKFENKAVSFDAETKRAIVDTIPELLTRINNSILQGGIGGSFSKDSSSLSGKQFAMDYNTGEIISIEKKKELDKKEHQKLLQTVYGSNARDLISTDLSIDEYKKLGINLTEKQYRKLAQVAELEKRKANATGKEKRELEDQIKKVNRSTKNIFRNKDGSENKDLIKKVNDYKANKVLDATDLQPVLLKLAKTMQGSDKAVTKSEMSKMLATDLDRRVKGINLPTFYDRDGNIIDINNLSTSDIMNKLPDEQRKLVLQMYSKLGKSDNFNDNLKYKSFKDVRDENQYKSFNRFRKTKKDENGHVSIDKGFRSTAAAIIPYIKNTLAPIQKYLENTMNVGINKLKTGMSNLVFGNERGFKSNFLTSLGGKYNEETKKFEAYDENDKSLKARISRMKIPFSGGKTIGDKVKDKFTELQNEANRLSNAQLEEQKTLNEMLSSESCGHFRFGKKTKESKTFDKLDSWLGKMLSKFSDSENSNEYKDIKDSIDSLVDEMRQSNELSDEDRNIYKAESRRLKRNLIKVAFANKKKNFITDKMKDSGITEEDRITKILHYRMKEFMDPITANFKEQFFGDDENSVKNQIRFFLTGKKGKGKEKEGKNLLDRLSGDFISYLRNPGKDKKGREIEPFLEQWKNIGLTFVDEVKYLSKQLLGAVWKGIKGYYKAIFGIGKRILGMFGNTKTGEKFKSFGREMGERVMGVTGFINRRAQSIQKDQWERIGGKYTEDGKRDWNSVDAEDLQQYRGLARLAKKDGHKVASKDTNIIKNSITTFQEKVMDRTRGLAAQIGEVFRDIERSKGKHKEEIKSYEKEGKDEAKSRGLKGKTAKTFVKQYSETKFDLAHQEEFGETKNTKAVISSIKSGASDVYTAAKGSFDADKAKKAKEEEERKAAEQKTAEATGKMVEQNEEAKEERSSKFKKILSYVTMGMLLLQGGTKTVTTIIKGATTAVKVVAKGIGFLVKLLTVPMKIITGILRTPIIGKALTSGALLTLMMTYFASKVSTAGKKIAKGFRAVVGAKDADTGYRVGGLFQKLMGTKDATGNRIGGLVSGVKGAVSGAKSGTGVLGKVSGVLSGFKYGFGSTKVGGTATSSISKILNIDPEKYASSPIYQAEVKIAQDMLKQHGLINELELQNAQERINQTNETNKTMNSLDLKQKYSELKQKATQIIDNLKQTKLFQAAERLKEKAISGAGRVVEFVGKGIKGIGTAVQAIPVAGKIAAAAIGAAGLAGTIALVTKKLRDANSDKPTNDGDDGKGLLASIKKIGSNAKARKEKRKAKRQERKDKRQQKREERLEKKKEKIQGIVQNEDFKTLGPIKRLYWSSQAKKYGIAVGTVEERQERADKTKALKEKVKSVISNPEFKDMSLPKRIIYKGMAKKLGISVDKTTQNAIDATNKLKVLNSTQTTSVNNDIATEGNKTREGFGSKLVKGVATVAKVALGLTNPLLGAAMLSNKVLGNVFNSEKHQLGEEKDGLIWTGTQWKSKATLPIGEKIGRMVWDGEKLVNIKKHIDDNDKEIWWQRLLSFSLTGQELDTKSTKSSSLGSKLKTFLGNAWGGLKSFIGGIFNGNDGSTLVVDDGRGGAGGTINGLSNTGNIDYSSLGTISEKYETGGRGGGTISNTEGDYGGKSYGVSQFSTTTGSANSFVKWLKNQYPDMGNAFGKSKAGTSDFDTAWKSTYNTFGEAFTMAQREYTYNKMVLPFIEKAKKDYGVDLSKTRALQELAYSTAVQFGSAGTYALGDINSNMTEDEIIRTSYAAKRNNVSTWFRGSSAAIQTSLKNNRFTTEEQDVLALVGQPASNFSSSSNEPEGSVKVSGVKTELVNNFPYFSQHDSRWGHVVYTNSNMNDPNQTISSSGCGTTSMAMVLRSFGNDVTPVDTSSYSVANGFRTDNNGTAWSFFNSIGKKYGLTTNDIGSSINSAVDYLNKGYPVIASGKGSKPFTSGGHYVVFSGTDNQGNILVNDPNDKGASTKYSKDNLKSKVANMWAFSKNGKGSIGNIAQISNYNNSSAATGLSYQEMAAKNNATSSSASSRSSSATSTGYTTVSSSATSTGYSTGVSSNYTEILTKLTTISTILANIATYSNKTANGIEDLIESAVNNNVSNSRQVSDVISSKEVTNANQQQVASAANFFAPTTNYLSSGNSNLQTIYGKFLKPATIELAKGN